MSKELSSFAARLRDRISSPAGAEVPRLIAQERTFSETPHVGCCEDFAALALELFAVQFKHNAAYRKICEARNLTPSNVKQWTQIPAVPTSAFKELELTSLTPEERPAVFHSSGTTEQKPSRHFHNAESLAVYEASLWKWFEAHFGSAGDLIFLTPPPSQAPHSSLIHMFEVVRQRYGLSESAFRGQVAVDGSWALDFAAVIFNLQTAGDSDKPVTLLGTAFSFVHLLDELVEKNLMLQLPPGSRVMETGGYKNRSRALPKTELHALVTARLGVPRENIICEYGMSELSSQAYDLESKSSKIRNAERQFHFPPWARVQIISPETGLEAAEGETGIIRILDLANVFSVAAIQTEDLGIRRGDGFELIGRARRSEPRGCSLMTA
ncbi:MAG: long-chain fatty acid--CoA ligase [Verrucomicrobiae bacterium]|nr:long-chain fatty acid--CoA ligase [Verrucomicrobiae bacterium]